MRHRRPAKEPVAACLLLFLVASLHGQVAAVAEGADCALGCPHILDLVCGADHNTYQSRCLAECQGVEVVAENACNDENFTTRNPRAIHLHRLLLNTPSNLNQQQRTDHDTLQQQPQQQQQQQQPRPQHKAAQDLGHASKDEQPQARQRMLSQTDMQTFRKEGFKLLGLIHLQDQAEDEPGACTNERNEQDDKYGALGGSNSNSNHGPVSTTVRALRVTQKGLLYAAMYDLDALTPAIKNASIRSGLAPPPPQQPESSDQQQGNSEQGSSGDTQYAGLGPGGQDIIQQSNGMPCLSYFNPHKHQQHTKQQRKQLQETTINPPPTYGSGAVDGSASEYAPPADLQQVEITSPPPELPPPSPSTSPLPTFAPPPPLLPSLPTCPIKQFPYTAIGQLQLKNSKGALVCSGVLVGSDAVLTAAHCVFQRDNQGGGSFFSRLDFAAGRYRADNVTYNPYNVTAWAFATIFHTYQSVPDIYSFDWDVAIIRLSSPVGDEAGWLGMASGCAVSAATGQPATSYTVATAGYASAAPFGTCTASTCSIIRDDCQSSTAYHTCPSLSGQSGSPFFMQKDFRVRGILVGTIPAANGNPLKITHLVGTKSYSALLKWIAEPLPGAIDEETNGLTVVAGSAAAAASENEVAADALDTNSTTMAGQVANATLMINTMAGNVSSQVLMDAQSAPPHPGPLSPPNRNGTLPPPPPRKVAVSRNSTALRNRPPPPGPHSTPCNRTGSRRALSCRTRSRQRRQLATVYSQKQQPCQA